MKPYVTLPGSDRDLLPDSRPAGSVDPTEIASLTVRVRSVGDPATLAATGYKLAETPLAERCYLTHAELEQRHGASHDDLDAVEHYANAHNLTIAHRSASERTVVLTGKLGDLLSAFHANVQIYHHALGTYRGRRGEIGVPPVLASIVTGVFGFDTRPKLRSPRRNGSTVHDGPGGPNGMPATEFAKRYKFPTASGDTPLDGTGQTIAIIELGGGYRNSDLQLYFKEIGVPAPTVSAISVDHAGNHPTTPDSADGEVMLDIEVAGAVCPGSKIAVYFAPNGGDRGFLDAISAAVHDAQRKPSVISISWGGPESHTDTQSITAFHEVFAAAAALGITVCVAAGDHGTADMAAGHWDKAVHVDHPSCDDLVLSCGGTQIANGADVVWNDGTAFDPNVSGGNGWTTGGGISQAFGVPSYQSAIRMPAALAGGKPGRGVPDIAMSATNYFTRVDASEGPSGGTSAVAPLMAALAARLNQAAGKRVGFLNPFLYMNAGKGVVQDVTVGTNAIKNTAPGYSAAIGWDACTGLGTPDGAAILGLLQTPAATTVVLRGS